MKNIKKYTITSKLPALNELNNKTFNDHDKMMLAIEEFANEKTKGIIDENVTKAQMYLFQPIIQKASSIPSLTEFITSKSLVDSVIQSEAFKKENSYLNTLSSEQCQSILEFMNSDIVKDAEKVIADAEKEKAYMNSLEVIIAEELITDISIINSSEYQNAIHIMGIMEKYNSEEFQEILASISPSIKRKVDTLKTLKESIKILASKEFKNAKKVLSNPEYIKYDLNIKQKLENSVQVVAIDLAMYNEYVYIKELFESKEFNKFAKSLESTKEQYDEFVKLSTMDFESMKEEDVLETKTKIANLKKVANEYTKANEYMNSSDMLLAKQVIQDEKYIANFELTLTPEYILQEEIRTFEENQTQEDIDTLSAAQTFANSEEIQNAMGISESDEFKEMLKDPEIKAYSKQLKKYDTIKETIEEFAKISKDQISKAEQLINDPIIQNIVKNSKTDIYKDAITLVNSKPFLSATEIVNSDEYKSADYLIKSDNYLNATKFLEVIKYTEILKYFESEESKQLNAKLDAPSFKKAQDIFLNPSLKRLIELRNSPDFKNAVWISIRDSFDKATVLIKHDVISITTETTNIPFKYKDQENVKTIKVKSDCDKLLSSAIDEISKIDNDLDINIVDVKHLQTDTYLVFYK